MQLNRPSFLRFPEASSCASDLAEDAMVDYPAMTCRSSAKADEWLPLR